MQKKQGRLIEMYLRVKAFLIGNPAPAPAAYAEQQQVLDDVVAQLTGHSTSQASGGHLSQAEIKKQESLVRALRVDHLRPIVTIAKANVEDHPGIEKALRMPAGGLSVTRLLTEANAIHDAAMLYPPVFVKNGRPENFLDQLGAAIEAVRNSTVSKGTLVGRKAGAKMGIAQELRRGRKALNVLDAIVRSAFAGNDVVLREWEVAKKLRATGIAGSAATTQPTPTPSPATATAAATTSTTTPAAQPAAPKAA